MTRQRWWDVRELRHIRTGVLMGMYHRAAGCDRRQRYYVALDRDLTSYERGFVNGWQSSRTGPFRRVQP